MPRSITSATSLDNLRKEAKRWLRALRAHHAEAWARFRHVVPDAPSAPVLRDVQHALARAYGFDGWIALTAAVGKPPAGAGPASPLAARTAGDFDQLATDFVAAFDTHDEAALARMNAQYGRTFTFDDLWAEVWRRLYPFRQRAFRGGPQTLRLDEARIIIAQDAGFGSWEALLRAIATGAPRVPAFAMNVRERTISPRRLLTDREWDDLLAAAKEHGVTSLHASGMMTDAVVAKVAALDQITALDLGGSRELTDDGLLQLAKMPQLERLELSEYPGGKLTDRGLEVLRHLPNLRRFDMTWQRGITDAGAANLRFCDRLEHVSFMGAPTGDGVIEALQGKPRLLEFSSGRLVTDAGLPLLHNFPLMTTWTAGDIAPGAKDVPNVAKLLIDGPFTNAGLAGLAGLAGVADLDLFWHVTGITTDGFAHLVDLPNLMSLGADGALSDDVSMRHYGSMPRLRHLRAQGTVATDEGFEALSRSRTLEGLWCGKDPLQLGDRGFAALSTIPSLRRLGVSLANVSDAALSALPRFPALRELTPIGATDEGFRHIGGCTRLERLTCMYCRETTDAATAHIERLSIRSYYAGLTRITDRSLEILGRMPTLEAIEFYECDGITDAGLRFLAALPKLREVQLAELPGVSFEGTKVFPAHVRVTYAT